MGTVKRVMQTGEQEGYSLHAKTGWTREDGRNTGWWIGYLKDADKVCFFATRLVQDRALQRQDFGPCRKEVTLKIFRDLKVIDGE